MGRHAFHSELLVHEVDAATRDPEVAATLREYFYNLDRGVYKRLNPLLVASVFQKVNENPPDRYDAYAYMLIHTEIGVGHYATCTIPVGHCPSEDEAVAENNEKLRNVPDIFQVYFRPQHGANGGNDGLLSWEREVGLWLHVNDTEHAVFNVWLDPRNVALEVGLTNASKTLSHMRDGGAVCRWPYNFDRLFLMVDIQQFPYRRKELVATYPCNCEKELTSPVAS